MHFCRQKLSEFGQFEGRVIPPRKVSEFGQLSIHSITEGNCPNSDKKNRATGRGEAVRVLC